MADALTLALDRFAHVLVREGGALEHQLAAETPRNTGFTWPADAPALHESLVEWFSWREITEDHRHCRLHIATPHPEVPLLVTAMKSPEAALELWRQRPGPFLEALEGVQVKLDDGSVWIGAAATDDGSPEPLRIADSLTQLIEWTISRYAARAASPWRALRFESTSEPWRTVPWPGPAELAAMSPETAVVLRWRRTLAKRPFVNALVGVRLDDERWLIDEGGPYPEGPLDPVSIELTVSAFRVSCYEDEPKLLSSEALALRLEEVSKRARYSALDCHLGAIHVWRQSPIAAVLERLREVLIAVFPDVASSLRTGASERAIQELEALTGRSLPGDLRALLTWADGQPAGSIPLRMNMRLLSASEMAAATSMMRELQRNGMLQPFWWNAGFLPFCGNDSGDYLCLDLDGVYGPEGCVLEFYHRDHRRRVEAASLAQWLEAFVDGLERGHWSVEDGRVMPRDWGGVKAFECVRTPGFPRTLSHDAPARWGVTGT